MAGTSVGVRCPLAHSTTNGRGARSKGDCVCQVGYYMDEEEGCVPCHAMGTNCTTVGVTVATLPLLADWWRLPNSTQLERCFAISNCTGGSDALQLCGEGYEVELSLSCPLYYDNVSHFLFLHRGPSAVSVRRTATAQATIAQWAVASRARGACCP